MFTLIKLSSPGWEAEFEHEEDLFTELDAHICEECYVEFMIEYGRYPEGVYDLLLTACGVEFMAEGDFTITEDEETSHENFDPREFN
jgi:hypothetical protein